MIYCLYSRLVSDSLTWINNWKLKGCEVMPASSGLLWLAFRRRRMAYANVLPCFSVLFLTWRLISIRLSGCIVCFWHTGEKLSTIEVLLRSPFVTLCPVSSV